MEVILKEDVPKLGNRGEVVKVAEGYGRNFLLPKKLAIEATSANKTVIEQMKAASVRRSAKEKTEAEALAKQFDGLEVKFLRKSGEGDHQFIIPVKLHKDVTAHLKVVVDKEAAAE
jgi:large subunit ribosomal protein L9